MLITFLGTAVIAFGIWFFFFYGQGFWDLWGGKINSSNFPIAPPKEKAECPISGEMVDQGKIERRVLAIAVENHTTARPQSGMDNADIVYEALAEGGITRFLLIYLCRDSSEIGPVRSARPYYIDWLTEFDAGYAHIGGSPNAFKLIKSIGVLDLDEFGNSAAYWRDSSRYAPHNVYTTTERLWNLIEQKGESRKSDFEVWKFKDDAGESERPDSAEIKIRYSKVGYGTEWKYDRSSNKYLRSQEGKAFTDKPTGKQLETKNLIVMWTKTSPSSDGLNRLDMETIGSGDAKIFLDGKAIDAIWKKESRRERTRFYTKDNQEIEFNRGQSWISVVPVGTQVTH